MKLTQCVFLTILLLALTRPVSAAENVVLSVNATDAPISGANWSTTISGITDVGWLYTVPSTPTQTYTITDLGTEFGTSSSQVVTAEIFSGIPGAIQSQTLLGSGQLGPEVANTFDFATLNTPVTLTSGTTYFVAFENIAGLGVDVTDAPGATQLNSPYYDTNHSNKFATRYGGPLPSTGKAILELADNAAVPEPSTWALLFSSLAGLALFRRLRPQTKS